MVTYENIISSDRSYTGVKAPVKGLVNVPQYAGCVGNSAWECRGKEIAIYDDKSSVVADNSCFSG